MSLDGHEKDSTKKKKREERQINSYALLTSDQIQHLRRMQRVRDGGIFLSPCISADVYICLGQYMLQIKFPWCILCCVCAVFFFFDCVISRSTQASVFSSERYNQPALYSPPPSPTLPYPRSISSTISPGRRRGILSMAAHRPRPFSRAQGGSNSMSGSNEKCTHFLFMSPFATLVRTICRHLEAPCISGRHPVLARIVPCSTFSYLMTSTWCQTWTVLASGAA